MKNTKNELEKRFSTFDEFRVEYDTFDKFRKSFENRDIGLHRAVVLAIREFRDEYEFPKGLSNENEQLQHIFQLVDDAEVSPSKIVNAKRLDNVQNLSHICR